MRFDFAEHHLMHRGIAPVQPDLSRREAMKKLGAAGAAMAVAGTVGSSAVSAGEQAHGHGHGHGGGTYGPNQYSDEISTSPTPWPAAGPPAPTARTINVVR